MFIILDLENHLDLLKYLTIIELVIEFN